MPSGYEDSHMDSGEEDDPYMNQVIQESLNVQGVGINRPQEQYMDDDEMMRQIIEQSKREK